MTVGCPVPGCGPGECLVDACNPGGGADVSEIVWLDGFDACIEIPTPPADVRCAACDWTGAPGWFGAHFDDAHAGES